MKYHVLGPVEVKRDGIRLELGAYKQRALLALLLIHRNQVVSTDQIIDEIWGEDQGRDRQNALWTVVSRLRTVLEPEREPRSEGTVLVSRPPGYVLSVDNTDLDAARFEALAVEGRALAQTDPAAASLVFNEALALWHGRSFEEFSYEPWAAAEISRLEELRLATVEDRIRADLDVGRSSELVSELQSLVKLHPLRERLTGHLMLALRRSGRQSDALRVFGELRTRLGEELGLEPSAEIMQLEERIVLDDPDLHHATAVRALSGKPEPGLAVRGYEIREQIGQGAMGNVYLAYQPAIGREVAIKVIRPELANDPEFIRRFESEARAVAGLEHPWIVPVFDYWREPDSAFLVMRRFDHGNLGRALAAGPLPSAMATRIVGQVASALAAAHRSGVVHGHLKPSNVLLDETDNAYLADFGISTGGNHHSSSGIVRKLESEFEAPEVQTTGHATPQSDVYSLGAIAAQTLRGAVGPDGSADSTPNRSAADVIARAMAANPTERFPDVQSFMAALEAALGEEAEQSSADAATALNPYLGLRAFGEGDASRFFGRERLVERLLARLGHAGLHGRFAAVVGPSGSGKSSVVRAGVIPAVRSGALPGSGNWFVATMIPGRYPFESLEEALRTVAVDPPPNLRDVLAEKGIAAAANSLIADPAAQLLIVVDQLEELFSNADPSDAGAFLTSLAEAAAEKHSRVKVVATLRADFYDHPLRHREFGELLRLGTEVITPMSAEELERAITLPAAAVGVSYEPGLVATIVSDMAGQSTALPLLQYALTELFEQRQGATITAAAYTQVGRVSGALARRADSVYDGLDEQQQAQARDIFLRLVAVGSGTADTRRRVLLTELRDLGGEDVLAVLDRFGRPRLLTFDRDPATRSPTVEIAHEALLTEWGQLRRWVEDARLDVRAQRRLSAAASDWRERDHDTDYLLSGARLASYDGWTERPPVRLTGSEREFLIASLAQSQAAAEAEQRRVRRLRRLVASTAAALVVALVAGGFALRSRQSAIEAADEAELATLVSRSAAFRAEDPDLSLLLALEANRRSSNAETEQAVMNALGGATIVNRIARRQALVDDCYGSSLFRADGSVEFATVDGRMLTRDPVTGDVTDQGPPPAPCAIGVRTDKIGGATLPDGSRMWLGPDWAVELEFDEPTFPFVSGSDERAVTASFGEQPTVQLRDMATGEPVGEPIVGPPGFVTAAASPDQSLIAISLGYNGMRAGANGLLVVLDATSGDEVSRVDLVEAVAGMAWDVETGELVGGLLGGGIVTIDPASGEVLAEVETGTSDYLDVAIGADGLVIVVSRGQIVYVNRRSGRVGDPIELRGADEAWIRPDGLIVTRSTAGEIDVLDLTTSGLIEQSWGVNQASQVRMHDGRAAALDFLAQSVTVTDLATGEQTVTDLAADPDANLIFDALPDVDGFWAITGDHIAERWSDGQIVGRVALGSAGTQPLDPRLVVRFGDHFAAVGMLTDGTHEATLVRLVGDYPGVVLTVEVSGPSFAHPTPNGGLLTVGEDGMLRTYDRDGELVQELSTGLVESRPLSLDPSGRLLVMRSLIDSSLHIVDLTTGTADGVAPGVANHALTADGRLLAVVSGDGTVRLWDVERRAWAGLVWDGTGELGRSGPGWYDPATDSLWITSSGQLLQIPVDPRRWIDRACEIVGRDLTDDEWARYVPGDGPRQTACG